MYVYIVECATGGQADPGENIVACYANREDAVRHMQELNRTDSYGVSLDEEDWFDDLVPGCETEFVYYTVTARELQ